MSDVSIGALIGLIGVVVAGFVQWFIARFAVRQEAERLYEQLAAEFDFQQQSEWALQFRQIMGDLLAVTDPEGSTMEKTQIVPLTLKAQLMLDLRLPTHRTVNSLIQQLALKINSWDGTSDLSAVFRLHEKLLDASREMMFHPSEGISLPPVS